MMNFIRRIALPHACAFVVTMGLTAGLATGFASLATAQDGDKPAAGKTPAAASTKPAPAKPGDQAPQKPAAATPASAAVAPSPISLLAVDQAQKAGISACLPILRDVTAMSVGTPAHATISTWNKDAASQRIFSALNVIHYDNAIAPNAMSFVTVAPTPANKCDAGFMQVQPSKLSCTEIAQNIGKQKDAPVAEKLGAVMTYAPTPQGIRITLMDAPTGGCVVVSGGTFYGQ